MWRPSVPDPGDVKRMRVAREKLDMWPLVIHDSYLINLASCEPEIRSKSLAGFRGEVERAITLGAEYLVLHPGQCKGQPMEQALLNVIAGLEESTKGLKSSDLTILLENTVGTTGQIGSRFEELALLRRFASERMDIAMGFCLDTCHCFASGNYDVSTVDGLEDTVKLAEEVLGLDNVRVFHANDSKGACGSHLDRHANIGEGQIGREGFGRILRHPKLKSKPFVLETPVDVEGDDRKNLQALKTLSKSRRKAL